MRKVIYLVFVFLMTWSCSKPEDRSCYKSYGEISQIEYGIDSVTEFRLFKNIKYRFYQDSMRKVVVRGGENMLNLINIETVDYVTSINNSNKCNYLRKADKIIEVDIHYPYYSKIYAEPTDSIIFMDTLRGDKVEWQVRNGGGVLVLNVDVNHILVSVSYGVGSYKVGGFSKYANLSIQNLGRGDALELSAKYIRVYQNSNNDLLLNMEKSEVIVDFNGNGDVRFIGVPDSLEINGVGDGEVVTF